METADSAIPEASNGHTGSELVHNLAQFLRVAWFRRHTMMATLVVVCLLGGLYAATAKRYYEAKASILILQSGGDQLVPSMAGAMSNQDVMPTYQQLVTKAVVLDAAISRLVPEHLIDFQKQPRDKWVDTLTQNLQVRALRRTKLIEIKYRSLDPVVAAAVTQAVVDAYLAFIKATHEGTARGIIDVLRKENVKLQVVLDQKQQNLLAARRAAGDIGVTSGTQALDPVVQTAISLNEALIEAQKERMDYQATLDAIQSAVRKGEDLQQHVLAVEEAVGREILMAGLGFNPRDAHVQAELEKTLLEDRAELQTLSQHFGPNHPRVAEVNDRIRTTEQYLQAYQQRVSQQMSDLQSRQLGPMLVQMIQQALSRAWQHESSLRVSFEAARLSAIGHEGSLAQVKLLEHDVSRLQSLQDALIEKIASTDLRQENGDIRAEIVEHPEPATRPVSPRLPVVFVICLLATLILGGSIVYVQDILDDRFRTADELSMRLGVQVLTIVRQLQETGRDGLEAVQSFVSPHAPDTESFRTLRTSLGFHQVDSERLVVSSSEPGDGKTTVLANLAVTFAQAGKKTLLIDADMRRPGMTTLLDMKRLAGLSDILHGDEYVDQSAERHVICSDQDGLDIIPCGPRRPNPSELLASERMGELLAWADANYDQVLIDSPPALVASDAVLIGRLVDGVMIVVRPEKNRRRLVTRAVDTFRSLSIPVFGIVANCVSNDAQKGYGFDYGYGYGYGYGSDEKHDADDAAVEIEDVDYEDDTEDIYPIETAFATENSMIVPRKAG